MNPILNNAPTYSPAGSVASTSTSQAGNTASGSSGSDALQLLRQPIPDHLGDYERETIMNERSDAFGQLISSFSPSSPIDFSGIDLNDIDISEAVSSGLQQQWTDVDIERYINDSDGVNLASFITNNGQLTPNQQTQVINGLINSIRDSGVDLTSIPDSLIRSLSDPIYASNNNITRFVRECQQEGVKRQTENEHQNNTNTPSGNSSLTDDFQLPSISGHGNVKALDGGHNQYFAETTNTMIRNRFKRDGLKSYNKIKPHDPGNVSRQKKAWPAVNAMKSKMYHGMKRADYTPAMKTGMGNCDEMSGIAEQIINNSGGHARKYNMPGKHVFTLVGKVPAGATDNVHFSDYGKCWIVDPWANIACKASEYTEKFKEKMEKWAGEGKLLLSKAGWISPMAPEWVDECINCQKNQILPESEYNKQEDEKVKEPPQQELPPPVREALDNLDPQKESTTTEDMQKALKKAKELGPDTFLRWLDEADVAKRLAEGILSGQSITSCGLLLEDLANDLLDLLKNGAVPAKRICAALFPPQAKAFIMAAIPQLMLKPAGVRLTRLMEQLAQKDEGTRSDLVDSMSKRSCVPSIERANSEKSDFYDRVASVYDRSVFPKITAARKNKLRDHLPLAFYKKSSEILESGRLMDIKHKKIASFTKIRSDAERIAQRLSGDEFGHRDITPEMLRETQLADNESFEKKNNAIVAFRKNFIKTKISSDRIATAKQHRPEPEIVRNLNRLAADMLSVANESNAVKTAEWESRQVRIEPLPGTSDVATDGFLVRAMAASAIKGASRDAASMARPAGHDISSMIGEGKLRREASDNISRPALVKDLHKLWDKTIRLLESGVEEEYEDLLFSVLEQCERGIYADALEDYLAAFQELNTIGSGIVNELTESGWGGLVTAPEPTPVKEKEPERQAPAESSPSSSPPSKKNKKTRQALLA
ncbi:hypothetical protein SC171_11230 [Pantoea cypripedii]|uniref:hypothetical protein n=1 Tax=Pantoea cypripedii TaxID=55209 RepID=UPI002FC6A61A